MTPIPLVPLNQEFNLHRVSSLPRTAIAAVLAVSASFGLAMPAFAQDKDTVRAALVQEPESLDPIYDTNLPALTIFYNVFDQLAGIDATGKVVPRLATSWTASDDLKSWSFKLREGATCQDGSPITSADVLFTFETAMTDPKSRVGGYLTAVEKVEAKGDYEVDFTLKQAFAPFDRQATLVPIVCKAAYEAMGAAAYAKTPVGSGPYQVVSWTAGDSITLKRFDSYWGDKGKYANVIFQVVPDETTRANAVQSGDLDVALLGPSNVPAVQASGAVDVVTQQSNRILYLGFNSKQPMLSKLDMRKGIDMAIDRGLVAERLLDGSVTPTSQLVAPASFGFDTAIPATTTDLEQAKALIAAAGYDGSPIPLSYPTTGLPQIDQIAQAVDFFVQQAGVKTTLDPQEANTYINSWFTGSLPGLYLFAFAPSVMDADLPFSMLLKTGGQGYNSDAEIDALLDKQIAEADPVARAADLSKISTIVNTNTYYAPLFIDTYTYGVAKGLNWSPRPDGMIVFY
jgi:peptide/nickel transport system substrate-binding protein